MKIWTILEENIWFLGLKLYQKIFHQWFVGGKMWRKLFFYPFSQKSRTIGRFSIEKVFLEISQNSQENTCARASFLIKLQASASYFHMKTTILAGFQMCISVLLNDRETLWKQEISYWCVKVHARVEEEGNDPISTTLNP